MNMPDKSAAVLVEHSQNRRMLKRYLSDREFEVKDGVDAENGFEAPDICILDANSVPDWSKELRQLKNSSRIHIPVLLLTEDTELGKICREVESWVDQVARMPLKKEVLEGQINTLLHARELSVELEEEKRRIKSTLYTLLESSPDPSLVVNQEGEIREVNTAFRELFSIQYKIVGRGIDELSILPQNEIETVKERIEEVKTSSEPSIKTVSLEIEGEKKYVEVKSGAVTKDGETIGAIGIFRDVTLTEKRVRALESIRRKLEMALEETNTGVWEWNLETDEVAWTESIEKLFETEVEDAATLYETDPGEEIKSYRFEPAIEMFSRKIRDKDMRGLRESLEEARETGSSSLEMRIERNDGYVWLRCDTVKTEDTEGNDVLMGVTTDVTEIKKRGLVQEAVFNQTFQYTGLIDTDGVILKMNDSALEFGGG